MFNVFGVCMMLLIFSWFLRGIEWVTLMMAGGHAWDVQAGGEYPYMARYLANGHTLFNLVNALIFLIFLPFLIRVAILLSPRDRSEGDELFRLPVFEPNAEDNSRCFPTKSFRGGWKKWDLRSARHARCRPRCLTGL